MTRAIGRGLVTLLRFIPGNRLILPDGSLPLKADKVHQEVRPMVACMAMLMEQILRLHDDRPGWQDCDPRWLFNRLVEEVRELYDALDKRPVPPSPDGESSVTREEYQQWALWVAREAADVANFASMIADVVGGLEEVANGTPVSSPKGSNGISGVEGH